MKFYVCIMFFSVIILTACGESKEDIGSRQELSAIIRQLNLTVENFTKGQKVEENLSMITADNYYLEYLNEIKEIRKQLAKVVFTEKFVSTRNKLDSISVLLTNIIEHRNKLTKDLDPLLNLIEEYNSNRKYYYQFKNGPYTSDLLPFVKTNAMKIGIKISIKRSQYRASLNSFELEVLHCYELCLSQNIKLNSLNFIDTLHLYNSLNDSSQFHYKIFKIMSEFDTTTDDF